MLPATAAACLRAPSRQGPALGALRLRGRSQAPWVISGHILHNDCHTNNTGQYMHGQSGTLRGRTLARRCGALAPLAARAAARLGAGLRRLHGVARGVARVHLRSELAQPLHDARRLRTRRPVRPAPRGRAR